MLLSASEKLKKMNETKDNDQQFLQEIVEPEVNIPVEPQVLFEDPEEINIKTDDSRVIIKAGRLKP